MTCMVMSGDGLLDMPLVDFFLKGDTSLDAVSSPNPASSWCVIIQNLSIKLVLFVHLLIHFVNF